VKRLVEEVEGEGLAALLGERVLIRCVRFFYAGKLVGVNDTCVKLADPCIVYDEGAPDAKAFATAEKMPDPHYVQIPNIESFGRTHK
jgi:hypothetical protein